MERRSRARLAPLAAGIFLFGLIAGLALRPATERAAGTAWLPVASGAVEFLGAESRFSIRRRPSPALFRTEEPDGTAYEHPKPDRAFEMFARERLAGLGPGDSAVFAFRIEMPRGRGAEAPRSSARWAVAVEEEARGGETWYRAELGTGAQSLYSRSLDGLKDAIARELGREFAARLGPLAVR